MRHFRKSIQRRRPQTAVDQQRIVVAYERETDHADGLEQPRPQKRESFTGVSFQFGCHLGPFDENGGDDDQHADECES